MKKLTAVLAVILAAASGLVAGDMTLASGLVAPNVCSWDKALSGKALIAGHFEVNQCKMFAMASLELLRAKGVKSGTVDYSWELKGKTGQHVFVVYVDGKTGKLMGMDNSALRPREVTGTTDHELARSFDKLTTANEFLGVAIAPIAVSVLLK